MTTPLIGAFAQFLKANRERCNAKFASARHFTPTLNGDVFSEHLVATVAPIVEAVAQAQPSAVNDVAEWLYDLSLDLLEQEFIGSHSRYPFIGEGWRTLLPALAKHIVAAPRQVIGAVTNALYNLSLTPTARPQEWIDDLIVLAPLCSDVSTLLSVGQILAWRVGLAHYRNGALALCKQLEPKLVLRILQLPANLSKPSAPDLLNRIIADPWLHPPTLAQANKAKQTLQIVAQVGAFRGFGGLFLSPPTVTVAGDQFIVRDGEQHWVLTADCYGATFHRSEPATGDVDAGPFEVDRNGKVTLGRASQVFPELANCTSAADNHTTLAVTTPLSHAVFLVAVVNQ
jgi:hypothetical protein